MPARGGTTRFRKKANALRNVGHKLSAGRWSLLRLRDVLGLLDRQASGRSRKGMVRKVRSTLRLIGLLQLTKLDLPESP